MNGPRRQRGAMRNVFWLLGLAALAFCTGFVLERLFRPFRKPVVVFLRHPLPHPHHDAAKQVPVPRQLA